MNKSLENVIRKAAFKGIEPLRRRYTAVGTAHHGSNANSSGLNNSVGGAGGSYA